MFVDRLRSVVAAIPALRPAAWWLAHRLPALQRVELDRPAETLLLEAIQGGRDLRAPSVRFLAAATEERLSTDNSLDRIGIHRSLGTAIFARSAELYAGEGLPAYLKRYTYPPFLSIALNSHCNAACFFCRESDYKGSSVDFGNLVKLRSAIENARMVDLTGWGEPFFYPHFEKVVDYITSVNTTTPHFIQVTTNGSFLSERWGKMLRGKVGRVVISINAASAPTYAQQMRYKNDKFTFDDTIAKIEAFQRELTDEDRKRFIMHMVANTDNYNEITDLVHLAKRLGIPCVNVGHFICANSHYIDKTLWNVKESYNAEMARARVAGQELDVLVGGRSFFVEEKEKAGAESCMAPFEQFFVEMPGTSVPCCFMGNQRMGNVYEDGFETVWFSPIMTRLRVSRSLAPCKVCTIFTPFDRKTAHISATVLTTAEEAETPKALVQA